MRAMGIVRYVLPALLFLGGFVLFAIDPGANGLHGLAMATGAALSLLLLNWLYRVSVQGGEDRSREEAARAYFDRHGRWPDE